MPDQAEPCVQLPSPQWPAKLSATTRLLADWWRISETQIGIFIGTQLATTARGRYDWYRAADGVSQTEVVREAIQLRLAKFLRNLQLETSWRR